MKKKLTITNCSDCPYFDNSYYDYSSTCSKLEKVNNDHMTTILEDCPLEDAKEEGNEKETSRNL